MRHQEEKEAEEDDSDDDDDDNDADANKKKEAPRCSQAAEGTNKDTNHNNHSAAKKKRKRVSHNKKKADASSTAAKPPKEELLTDEDEDDDTEAPLSVEPPKKKKRDNVGAPSTPHPLNTNNSTHHKRERSKSMNTVASRMKQVVDHMVASQKAGELHPTLTVFLYKSPQSEIVNAFFSEMQRENPALFDARDELLALIARRYDEFVAGIVAST